MVGVVDSIEKLNSIVVIQTLGCYTEIVSNTLKATIICNHQQQKKSKTNKHEIECRNKERLKNSTQLSSFWL